MMREKLGLIGKDSNDEKLVLDLLTWMHENRADYTNTFCFLMNKLKNKDQIYANQQFLNWKKRWESRRKLFSNLPENSIKIMKKANPLVIPRNHKVEEALTASTKNNDLTKIHELFKILKNPYENDHEISSYQQPPEPGAEKYKTFCGT